MPLFTIITTHDSVIIATHDSVIIATDGPLIRATHPRETCSTEVFCPVIVWVFHKALVVGKGDKREDAGQMEGGVSKHENISGRCYRSAVHCQLSTVSCPLSAVRCQLSNVSCQRSAYQCQLFNVYSPPV